MNHVRFKRIAAACLAVAAGLAMPGARAQTPEPVVVYQAFQSLQYLPLYVAIDKGLFQKHGLAVQKVTAGSGAAGVAAVIGGHADFSLQDPMTAMLANLKGASLVNVANVVAGVPVWVVTPGDSKLRDVGDLAGRHVATALPPSTSTYLLQGLVNERKLGSVTMNTVQLGTELASVAAGRADAAAVYMPQAEMSFAQGYRVVYAFPKAYPGGYAFSTIDTLTATVRSKPQMVAAFVKALGEAEALIQASHDEAKAVARAEFPALAPAIVDSAVQRLIDQKIYAATPDISEPAFRNALALQESIGNIKPGAVSYATGVDNRFAAAASR